MTDVQLPGEVAGELDDGFEAPEPEQVTLRWTEKYRGLWITMVRSREAHLRMAARVQLLSDDDEITAEDAKIILDLFDSFASHLVDWNVKIKGKPVPATSEGIARLDDTFVMDLIMSWLGTVTGGGAEAGTALAVMEEAAGERLATSIPVTPLGD